MKALKRYAALVIVAGVVSFFGWYLSSHSEVWHKLSQVDSSTILLLIGLYILTLIPLVIILLATVQLSDVKIKTREGFLLAIYTAIINFFGPLQSGPGFRAVYLKKKHQISLKKYGLVSLKYYAMFAYVNMLFMLFGGGLWQLGSVVLVGGVVAALAANQTTIGKQYVGLENIRGNFVLLFGTILLISTVAVIFGVELHTLNSTISFGQVLSYTGAANYSLFVAITPGAIGFRESFILFTERLHHLDHQTIIAANALDRSVYVVFLGILFLVSLVFHVKDRLATKQLKQSVSRDAKSVN